MQKPRGVTIALSVFLLGFAALSHGGPLEEGLNHYVNNEPVEARLFLEQALAADPGNEEIYNYLGIVYEQLGEHEKAVNVMQRGLEVADDLKSTLYLNIGNNFFSRGEKSLAEEMYGKAIEVDPGFPDPYLNRANARLELEKYEGALSDYTLYLRIKPAATHRAEVQKMIDLIRAYLERERIEEQQRAAQERALMDEVLNALKNASEDAQNLSTGTDEVLEEKEPEIDIED